MYVCMYIIIQILRSKRGSIIQWLSQKGVESDRPTIIY